MNSYSIPMYPWESHLSWIPALVSPTIFLQNGRNNFILQGFIFLLLFICIVYVMGGVCYSEHVRSEVSFQGAIVSFHQVSYRD